MISRVLIKYGLATPAILSLLLVASTSVAWGISSSTRDIEGSLLFIFSWFGILLGWLLAARHVKSRLSFLVICITSLFLLLIFYSDTITASSRTLSTLNTIITKSINESSPLKDDLPTLNIALKEMGQALSEPFMHLASWVNNLLNNKTLYDPVIPSIFWSLALWLAALWTGYYLRTRKDPLMAMAPLGGILAASLNYVRSETYPLLLYIAVTLIIISVMHYKKREHTWITSHTDYAEDIALDTHLITIPISVLLVLIGTFTPLISIKGILRVSQKIYQTYEAKAESAGELLGLESHPEISSDYPSIKAGGLPREHLLGSGPELNEELVMTIRVNDPAITGEESSNSEPPGYYWRAVIYDQYTGAGWETSPTESSSYRRGEPVLEKLHVNNQGIRLIELDVQRIQTNNELLYTSGTIVKADHAYRIERRITDDDSFDLFAGTIKARNYRVDSLLAQFSDGQMRNMNGESPAWVLERYLQLPPSLPERVRNLAQEITLPQVTTYEKSLAIESYLRQFPYSLQISKPPPGRDVADYFLFDLRQGYCDYYATAMVVLARAVGIPARLVIGYASGRYDREKNQYVVTEADAHSWPELYMPGAGWVEFEPTGGRPAIQRPDWETPSVDIKEIIPTRKYVLSDFIKRVASQRNYPILFILLIGLVLAAWIFTDVIRILFLPPAKAVVFAFRQFHRQALPLTRPNNPGDTPNEFAYKLQVRLQQINPKHSDIHPAISKDIQEITELYNQRIFSSRAISKEEKERSSQSFWRTQWRVRFAMLKYKLTNIIFLVIIGIFKKSNKSGIGE